MIVPAQEDDRGRMGEARQHYEETQRIGRQLARQNPDAYLPDLADSLISMGEGRIAL